MTVVWNLPEAMKGVDSHGLRNMSGWLVRSLVSLAICALQAVAYVTYLLAYSLHIFGGLFPNAPILTASPGPALSSNTFRSGHMSENWANLTKGLHQEM